MLPDEIEVFKSDKGDVILEVHRFENTQINDRYWLKLGVSVVEVEERDIESFVEVADKLQELTQYKRGNSLKVVSYALLTFCVGLGGFLLGGAV